MELATIYYGDPSDPLPEGDGTIVVFYSDGTEVVRRNGEWHGQKRDEPFRRVKDQNGKITLVVDNLTVRRNFTAEESYFQSVNGMNGALMIAPSGKVKNFSKSADRLLPTAKMVIAENVTASSAIFSARISPNANGRITYWFEYGPSIAERPDGSFYATTTRKKSVTGVGSIEVRELVQGLTKARQYSVHLCIQWSGGVYTTNGVKFATTSEMFDDFIQLGIPTVYATEVTGIQQTQATLGGLMKVNGAAGTWHGYFRLWIADGTYEIFYADVAITAIGDSKYFPYTIAGLKSSTTYYYSAGISDGTVAYESAPFCFSTLAEVGMTGSPMVGATDLDENMPELASVTSYVNPRGVDVSYQFEWWHGTSMIRKGPMHTSSATTNVVITESIETRPGKEYHAQLVAYYEETTGPYGATEVKKIAGAPIIFTASLE